MINMKKAKIIAVALLTVCMVFSMAGCSTDDINIKDNLIDGFNGLLQHFSKYALTKEKDLQGDRTEGEDTYTGSYSAEYKEFNGTEYIFGGTGLERKNGNNLTVTYKLTVDSGTVKFYWRDKDEDKIIADTSGTGAYSVTLNTGDNYLALEGDDFCGSLQVDVQ